MTPIFIFEFIIAIALMILVHEFGHFVACRICKVEVEEFGIFLPPRALKLFHAGGTDFTLNWIPLGGFVRPKGELDPDVPGGLASSPAWKRILVSGAGPFMNILLAVILYITIALAAGEPDPARLNVAQIQGVMRDSPAQEAGLLNGDILLSINDIQIIDQDHARQILKDNIDQEVTIEIQRGEEIFEISATPLSSRSEEEGALGIALGTPTRRIGLIKAIGVGFQATYNHIALISNFIGQLISGDLALKGDEGLVGPVGMGEIYVQIREFSPASGIYPFVDAIFFFINITISLGLFNLIPIPALDGGRILMTLPELILHRRIPKKVETILNSGSYFILLLLMIIVLVRDVANLFLD